MFLSPPKHFLERLKLSFYPHLDCSYQKPGTSCSRSSFLICKHTHFSPLFILTTICLRNTIMDHLYSWRLSPPPPARLTNASDEVVVLLAGLRYSAANGIGGQPSSVCSWKPSWALWLGRDAVYFGDSALTSRLSRGAALVCAQLLVLFRLQNPGHLPAAASFCFLHCSSFTAVNF